MGRNETISWVLVWDYIIISDNLLWRQIRFPRLCQMCFDRSPSSRRRNLILRWCNQGKLWLYDPDIRKLFAQSPIAIRLDRISTAESCPTSHVSISPTKKRMSLFYKTNWNKKEKIRVIEYYTLDGYLEKIQASSRKTSRPPKDCNLTRSSAVSIIRNVSKPATRTR